MQENKKTKKKKRKNGLIRIVQKEEQGKSSIGAAEIRKAETDKEESRREKTAALKTENASREESFEEDVNLSSISASFEPTKRSTPLIEERKKKSESQPVRDMEKFFEQVPRPKEEPANLCSADIERGYAKDFYSNTKTTYDSQRTRAEEQQIRQIKQDLRIQHRPRRNAVHDIELREEPISRGGGGVLREGIKYELKSRVEPEKTISENLRKYEHRKRRI